MSEPNILRELRTLRDETARRHNYDVRSLVRELAELQSQEGRKVVSCPPADLPRKKVSLEYITEAVGKRKAWEDLHWTLLNTKEFLFRH